MLPIICPLCLIQHTGLHLEVSDTFEDWIAHMFRGHDGADLIAYSATASFVREKSDSLTLMNEPHQGGQGAAPRSLPGAPKA